jgi:hypothetical protein
MGRGLTVRIKEFESTRHWFRWVGSGRARFLLNKHPVPWPAAKKTGGPIEAVQEFLKTKIFAGDRNREKHLVTQNPSGVLKQIS